MQPAGDPAIVMYRTIIPVYVQQSSGFVLAVAQTTRCHVLHFLLGLGADSTRHASTYSRTRADSAPHRLSALLTSDEVNFAKVVREVHKVWFSIDNNLDFMYTFAIYRSGRLARGTILERNQDIKYHISDAAGVSLV